MDKSKNIFKTLEEIHNLPTLPVVIDNLRKAVNDPNSNASRIAKIIEDDPSMMARIIKVVNSPLYAGREPIHSLQLAVARMGLNAISNIAMSTSVFSSFGKVPEGGFDRRNFWQHCICTGIAAVVIYNRCKQGMNKRFSRDLLHLAGLLHDIGKIVLDQFYHDDFSKALIMAREPGVPLYQAEGEMLGADHVQVGSWLGMKWNLSSQLLQVIRWHHEPDSSDVEHNELVMLVHSANYICNLEHIGDGGDLTSPSFQNHVWTKLGLSVRDISEIVDEVNQEAAASEVLLSFV